MYPPIKEKYVPSSPRRYSTVRRIIPRHAKAYLWLCFLVVVFGYMLLLDNGISPHQILFQSNPRYITNHNITTFQPQNEGLKPLLDRPHTTPMPISYPENDTPKLSSQLIFGSGENAFTPEDVVILFKTGATTLWSRVPIHLSTTLSNSTLTPNVVIYSDQTDTIAGKPIIDVLENVTSTLKSHPDFTLYHSLKTLPSQHRYLEHATIDGDHYLPGGWRLDKYKFLPMIAHAASTYPTKKWYIYMEDDNYYFLHSLYTYLSTLSPSQPLFLGGPAARLGEDFAHGGSGFILSGAALQKTSGANPRLAQEWESYASARCCGDQVLSHVLAVNGVPRDRRHDHTGFVAFQALQHWRMAFGSWNWCSPLFNVHKAHQGDVSRFHSLEKAYQAEFGSDKIMRWGTLFNLTLADEIIVSRKVEWDNEANEKWHSSVEADQELSVVERESRPWFSVDMCERACEEWDRCLSWKYADDNCGLSSTVTAGRGSAEGIELTSGWMIERVERLKGIRCEGLGYGS